MNELLRLAARLVERDGRSAAAAELARAIGAETLIVFVRDPDVGAMVSAPGFPQTLPNGRAWRRFLQLCVEHRSCAGELPVRSGDESVPVYGLANDESSVLVLIGTAKPHGDIDWLRALLPVFAAAFRGEQAAAAATAQARMAIDTANRAKSEFVATMSHELRTPLNAIGGHVELMALELYGPLTVKQQEALRRIDRNQRHLLGLINDILNLARIESGHVDYNTRDVLLAEVLADIGPMIEPQVAAKGLEYALDLPDRGIRVLVDAEKLQQVVLNLLSNAVKFTPAGGSVRLSVGRDTPPGFAAIRVEDTGVGIPADKQSMIFDPFVQVDSSHSRAGQGTGLGLSISRDLARGMGGDLRVESTPDAGSAFTLTIPLAG